MARAYPLTSLILLFSIVGVRKARSSQTRRMALVKDVAKMRFLIYEKLQEQSDAAHAVLHVRDDIFGILTAENENDILNDARKQREYWIDEVWPQVTAYICQDSRIKKTQRRELGGERQDYWHWVADKSTTKGKSFTVTIS